MLDLLLYAMILAGFQVMLPNVIGLMNQKYTLSFLLSARDNAPEITLMNARARRAWLNLMESMPFFIALSIIGLMLGQDLSYLMLVWLISRVIYVPAYVFDIPYLRTLTWSVSIVMLVQMGIAVSAA